MSIKRVDQLVKGDLFYLKPFICVMISKDGLFVLQKHRKLIPDFDTLEVLGEIHATLSGHLYNGEKIPIHRIPNAFKVLDLSAYPFILLKIYNFLQNHIMMYKSKQDSWEYLDKVAASTKRRIEVAIRSHRVIGQKLNLKDIPTVKILENEVGKRLNLYISNINITPGICQETLI